MAKEQNPEVVTNEITMLSLADLNKTFEKEIKICFDELCDSEENIKIENEEFKIIHKKWFEAEFKRSIMQVAVFLDKAFPTD